MSQEELLSHRKSTCHGTTGIVKYLAVKASFQDTVTVPSQIKITYRQNFTGSNTNTFTTTKGRPGPCCQGVLQYLVLQCRCKNRESWQSTYVVTTLQCLYVSFCWASLCTYTPCFSHEFNSMNWLFSALHPVCCIFLVMVNTQQSIISSTDY